MIQPGLRPLLFLLCACSLACSAAGPSASAPEKAAVPAPSELETDLHLTRAGELSAPPVIYLHGGPGSNSYLFEATTAEPLSQWFHVITYDRRGTGRSPAGTEEDFSFARAVEDLHQLVSAVPQPVILLGHSFGGTVALRYLDAHPDQVRGVVLVGAPVSFPRTFQTIHRTCRKIYEAKGAADRLAELKQVETLEPGTPQYVGYSFLHAFACGLYTPSEPLESARALYRAATAGDEDKMLRSMPPEPVLGFIANESYATDDASSLVERHKDRIAAIYGAEDGIIAEADVEFLRAVLPADRVRIVPAASHNVFVDQQPAFLAAMRATADRFDGN